VTRPRQAPMRGPVGVAPSELERGHLEADDELEEGAEEEKQGEAGVLPRSRAALRAHASADKRRQRRTV
jgi:hypothetical protein